MAGPVLSHRQRFDESNARSVTNLVGALQAIKAAKDDAEAKRRAGVQDKLADLQVQQGQQSVAQNQMTLDKQKQGAGYVSAFNDQLDREVNPGAVNEPAMPGQPSVFDPTPFSQKAQSAKGDRFKALFIAKKRTLDGQETTPEQVLQENEAKAAQHADFMASAASAPQLRQLDLRTKTATADSTEANAAKTKKETELLGAPTPEDKDKTFGNESNLLGKYLGQAKDFIAVRDSYGRIKSSAKKPSAAGDLSLIFNYMKMLDPGSTVREGEFANAQNAGGAFDRVGAMYNNVLKGERLTETQRKDFLDQAKGLYTTQKNIHGKTRKTFEDIATRSGLDPLNTAPDLSLDDEDEDPLGLGI